MIVMKKWLIHIRSAFVTGLAWATGCTLVGMLGVVVFYALFPNAPDIFDIWIPVFAYPGFLGGVIFSVLLRVLEGGRRVNKLPLSRVAAWGAVAGLLVGVLPFILGTPNARYPLWLLVVAIMAYTTLLCTASAVGSALLPRYAAQRKSAAGAGPKT